MDGGFKAYVRLGDVRPSEANPRKDFGDIDALARSLEATGGEPVNPIVLVRDGNVYRIVDGERRYRALCRIHGEDERVGALVFNDYGEASALVAMLATDDKMRLAPEEQAVGFQQMITLGVDEETTAKAIGRDVAQVRRARKALSLDPKPEQMNLDVLVLVGDEEFSDDERAELLAYCSAYSDVQWKARQIREKHDAARRLETIRLAMPDGIEFHDELLGGDGMAYVCEVRSAKEARSLTLEEGVDYHAFPEGTRRRTWKLYCEGGAGTSKLSKEAAKAAAEKEERDRKLRLMRTMRWSMMDFVLECLNEEHPLPLSATRELVKESRKTIAGAAYDMDIVCISREGDLQACEPSPYEVVMWLSDRIIMTDYWWNTPWANKVACRKIAEVWDTLVADGWKPSDAILEVREACGKGKE